MERIFGTAFDAIRIHEGAQASLIGAKAYTHGSNIYFAPGQFNLLTSQGQQLLGHELTHVLQQRAGKVQNPFGSGVALVQLKKFEAEAARMGILASHQQLGVQRQTRDVAQMNGEGLFELSKRLVEENQKSNFEKLRDFAEKIGKSDVYMALKNAVTSFLELVDRMCIVFLKNMGLLSKTVKEILLIGGLVSWVQAIVKDAEEMTWVWKIREHCNVVPERLKIVADTIAAKMVRRLCRLVYDILVQVWNILTVALHIVLPGIAVVLNVLLNKSEAIASAMRWLSKKAKGTLHVDRETQAEELLSWSRLEEEWAVSMVLKLTGNEHPSHTEVADAMGSTRGGHDPYRFWSEVIPGFDAMMAYKKYKEKSEIDIADIMSRDGGTTLKRRK